MNGGSEDDALSRAVSTSASLGASSPVVPAPAPNSSAVDESGQTISPAPAPPCLDHVLARPPTSHALSASLAREAPRELEDIAVTIASPAQPNAHPPSTLFDPLWNALTNRLRAHVNGFLSSFFFSRYVQLHEYASRHVQLSDFRVFRVLGRGAFGAVSAVQRVDTHAAYAMKEMSIRQVKHDQSEWMVINEKKILAKMNSPFVLGLKYSFLDEDNLYLLFDMCSGGDLKFHLRSAGAAGCFEPPRAKFYAAEVLLALEHLHAQDIVYRDLKPPNLLLRDTGHVVLSDLGLCIKLRKGKVLKHLAGTCGYWSPEVLQKAGTFKVSDLWSFGVLLYEFLTGTRPPCKCDKRTKQWCPFGQKRSMEENAVDSDGVLHLDIPYPPDKIDADARDLLTRLFEPDPERRLGAGGIEELKQHPYFASIDWEALACLALLPPFVPDARSVHANSLGEVGEFNRSQLKNVKITAEDEKLYEDFYFASESGVQAELLSALSKCDNPDLQHAASSGAAGTDSPTGCCTIL